MRYICMFAIILASECAISATSSTVSVSIANVATDSNLPNSVRDAFDDDDGRSLKSVSVDLNGDGVPEKLVPNEFLCGNGGCPWVIYSATEKRVIGTVFASTIVIQSDSIGGYKILIVIFSEGAKEGLTQRYAFIGGAYRKTGAN